MTTELAREAKLDLYAFVTGAKAMDFARDPERRAVAVFEEELTHFHVFFVACRPKTPGIKFHERIAPEFRTLEVEADVEFERRQRG